jgi:hypothetical protein
MTRISTLCVMSSTLAALALFTNSASSGSLNAHTPPVQPPKVSPPTTGKNAAPQTGTNAQLKQTGGGLKARKGGALTIYNDQ